MMPLITWRWSRQRPPRWPVGGNSGRSHSHSAFERSARPMAHRYHTSAPSEKHALALTHADDLEGQPHKGRVAVLADHGGSADELVAVHAPDLGLAGVAVVPNDVGLAVTVQIAHPDDLEGEADEGRLSVFAQHGGSA